MKPQIPPTKSKGKKASSKSQKHPELSQHELVPAYQEKLKLDPSKLKHLQELSYYLSDEGKAWVNALRERQAFAQEAEQDEEEIL